MKVDIRLISATNKNLIDMVKEGRFREDLFYRLNVFPITLPPLRVRRDDIAELARRFTARFAAEEGKRIRGISAEVAALLTSYDWPGNVRQLENAVFRAVVMCDGDELGVAEFPQIAARVGGFDVRVPALPASRMELPPRTQDQAHDIAMRDPTVMRLLAEDGHMRPLAEIEEQAIRFALQHYRSHMTEMARKLGIGRSTLYRKLRDLGLDHDAGSDTEAA